MGFEISDRFVDDRKSMKAGPKAIGLYTLCGAWSSGQRLDGFVPTEIAQRWDSELTDSARLVDAGLWVEDINADGEVGYRFVVSDGLCRFHRPSGNSRPEIPLGLRHAVYERDGYVCVVCSTSDHLTLDHIWPYSRGGLDTYENLQTMCRSCNSRKGARV